MPEPTVRRLLNEAEDPGGSYAPVHLNLFVNSETRQTQHLIQITETGDEMFEIAEEHLYQAASSSGYTVEEEGNDIYRLSSME